jgi:DNA adenine methylase
MKAPFVWFGGKRRVADKVWDALGNVDNYIEPFAGSLAVLLERPAERATTGARGAETVNDADGMIANFWRALAADPETVARWCDYPVNETDLFARHLWLVNTGRSRLLNGMEADPDYYDAQVAGWWVWGINAWIGSGWCSGTGPWMTDDEGIVDKRPHLGDAGRGVNRQLPHLGDAGQGVNRKLPHLGNAGRGVNQPDDDQAFTYGGSGAAANPWHNPLPDQRAVYGYMHALADRLRDVRVCCGDWTRVTTNGAMSYGSTVGVFLDPPYLGDVRTADLYAVDDHTISHDVRQWCLDNGDNPRLRIVFAGYDAEHDDEIPDTWHRIRYSAGAAYQTTANKGGQNEANRHHEVLWLSPHCTHPGEATPSLFDAA